MVKIQETKTWCRHLFSDLTLCWPLLRLSPCSSTLRFCRFCALTIDLLVVDVAVALQNIGNIPTAIFANSILVKPGRLYLVCTVYFVFFALGGLDCPTTTWSLFVERLAFSIPSRIWPPDEVVVLACTTMKWFWYVDDLKIATHTCICISCGTWVRTITWKRQWFVGYTGIVCS